MPSSNDSRASDARVSVDAPIDVDKRAIRGEWLRNSRWRDRLHNRAAHAALDIPEDEMINAPRITNGLGWKELAVLAATVLGVAYGVAKLTQPGAATTPPAVTAPADSEYEIRFFDKDGGLIPIPHISQKPSPDS